MSENDLALLGELQVMGRGRVPVSLKGQRFGRLVVVDDPVLKPRPDGRNRAFHPALCDCGRELQVIASNLRSGSTASCGCLHHERARDANTTHGVTRGGTKPRLYRIWKAMRERCSNPSVGNYQWYGGKGVAVCEEWSDYVVFAEWAQKAGYADDLEIDRIDSDGPYSPGNCRWLTKRANVQRARAACKVGKEVTEA